MGKTKSPEEFELVANDRDRCSLKEGRDSSAGPEDQIMKTVAYIYQHAGTLEFDGSQIVFRPEPPLPDEKIAAIGEDFAEDLNEGAPMSDFSGRPIPLEDLGSISAETWDRLGDVLASYSQGALALRPNECLSRQNS